MTEFGMQRRIGSPAMSHDDPTGDWMTHSDPKATERDPLPRYFGPYVLRGQLGNGGMAVVYCAYHQNHQRHCAVKIPKDEFRSEESRVQFDEEVRALRNLRHHPNLCGLVEAGEVEGVPYLEMPLIVGESLATVLHRGGGFSPVNAATLVHTLATAMQHAHDAGVLHRDLKPANILITRDSEPIIVDFGLALSLTDPFARITRRIGGTRDYIPPEVVEAVLLPDPPAIFPHITWDVYSLGVILYQLLTGRLPWPERTDLREHFMGRLQAYPLIDPRQLRPEVPPRLAQVCLRALERNPQNRHVNMQSFAVALASAIARPLEVSTPCFAPISPDRFRYQFVHTGAVAADPCPTDRLYLDVGNRLGPGVIDHHRLLAHSGSTTRLVHTYPELLQLVQERLPRETPLTICLHEWPDLDAVASTYLVQEYLVHGRFPELAPQLVRYVDWVDRGALGVTRDNPYSLYAAFQVLANRPHSGSLSDRWTTLLENGLKLLRYVDQQATKYRRAISAVAALTWSELFSDEEREAVAEDLQRYESCLSDTRCQPRQIRLRLPDLFGDRSTVDLLLVRDVQNVGDPNRCLFFKDWARLDKQRCPATKGFLALCVFHSPTPQHRRRCIISLRPGGDHQLTLRGLGTLLDTAEREARCRLNLQQYGRAVDDRQNCPICGYSRPPRPGYDNADPWYDGRSHGFTIVDSPAQGEGTVLSEEEIVRVLLEFGQASPGDVRSLVPQGA